MSVPPDTLTFQLNTNFLENNFSPPTFPLEGEGLGGGDFHAARVTLRHVKLSKGHLSRYFTKSQPFRLHEIFEKIQKSQNLCNHFLKSA